MYPGVSLPLSLQLQQRCLRLNEAMWTAKSTGGGFSVSFFWPASDLKSQVQPKKPEEKEKKSKGQKMVSTMTGPTYKFTPEPLIISPGTTLSSGTTLAPNNATLLLAVPHLSVVMKRKVAYSTTTIMRKEQQWTHITGRRRMARP